MPDVGSQFVHLHLHSEYSLLDGGNRLDKLVKRVKELGMGAVAVTDHGNLFGAAAFYQIAKENGVEPILGVEAYVTPPDRNRRDRTFTGLVDGGYHLVLLAENQEGWENLLVLCSEAFLTGFYYKPRIDRELLEKHSAGLIAINGHLGSEIGEHLLAYERSGEGKWWEKARESAIWHARTFKTEIANGKSQIANEGKAEGKEARPRFYVELQHHVAEQNAINKHLIRLAREVGAPLVCDNDSHFLKAEDHDAHDTLICISMGKTKNDPDRLHYPAEIYVKGPEQMRALFAEYGEDGKEALDNTVRIAERCAGKVKLPLGENHAPAVRVRRANAERGTRNTGKSKGEWEGMPRWDEERFGGDLTAWYRAYCDEFEVVPVDGKDEGELKKATQECDAALKMLAEAGFVWRYGAGEIAKSKSQIANQKETQGSREARRARLEREIAILCGKGISAYFLIVWDFVNWGRQRGIPAMARGSGVGTMVGYVLGLSNACPEEYGLLFERFTDPDRSEFPDIDIDLCQDGRGKVIDYVRRKYGHVAQIITFGTLKARAAIRDVARVLEVPLAEADKLAKLVPEQLGMTLDEALKVEPELRKLYEADERIRRVIDTGRTIEGQARHASVHAAGVIVATRPLHEIVPLYRQSTGAEHEIVTQWDGPTCEKMGLLKMDFLGLRTISVVERAKRLIRETLGEEEIWKAVGRERGTRNAERGEKQGPHPLDLDRLTYDDPRVFALFARADTTGVFQFESGGMRRLLVEMRPDRLEDLIAANALFRPGPMDLIPDYNRRKHGQAPVPKVHPIVDRFTSGTYGVMVYQEQVMQIVHELGGIKLRDAYTLIKNISKKKHDKIDKERPKFIEGAVSQGLSKSAANELFEMILKFAGYGFNKSHSTGYAIVAYQTAYLKTYFPNQYMAAFLTYESGAQKVSDWIQYVEDCKRTRFVNGKVGVEVRPPDVNLSLADFGVVFDPDEPHDALHGHVRFGLGAIKGTGDKAVALVIEERDGCKLPNDQIAKLPNEEGAKREKRPFTSLFDFCERVLAAGAGQGANGPRNGTAGTGVVNKGTVEALIKCGAMDALHPQGRSGRAAMAASLEAAMGAGQKAAADKAAGQNALFGLKGGIEASRHQGIEAKTGLAKVTPWSDRETQEKEKEVLGFYVSGHPLDKWKAWSGVFKTATVESARQMPQDGRVVLAGLVQKVRTIVVRNGRSAGQKMGIVTLDDLTGTVEGVLFADCFAQFGHVLAVDAPVFMLGRVDWRRAAAASPRGGAEGVEGGEEPGGQASGGEGGPQIVVDRVVPIEGVPLMPGRLWIRVDAMKLNGSGETALRTAAQVLTRCVGRGDGVNGTMADRASAFPVEVLIDTAEQRVRLEAGPGLRVLPTPEMVNELTKSLGEGSVKVVGGVAVEVTGRNGQDRSKWNKRGRE